MHVTVQNHHMHILCLDHRTLFVYYSNDSEPLLRGSNKGFSWLAKTGVLRSGPRLE
jgi:hypothetical protein